MYTNGDKKMTKYEVKVEGQRELRITGQYRDGKAYEPPTETEDSIMNTTRESALNSARVIQRLTPNGKVSLTTTLETW